MAWRRCVSPTKAVVTPATIEKLPSGAVAVTIRSGISAQFPRASAFPPRSRHSTSRAPRGRGELARHPATRRRHAALSVRRRRSSRATSESTRVSSSTKEFERGPSPHGERDARGDSCLRSCGCLSRARNLRHRRSRLRAREHTSQSARIGYSVRSVAVVSPDSAPIPTLLRSPRSHLPPRYVEPQTLMFWGLF
jgi:hypothetical protein